MAENNDLNKKIQEANALIGRFDVLAKSTGDYASKVESVVESLKKSIEKIGKLVEKDPLTLQVSSIVKESEKAKKALKEIGKSIKEGVYKPSEDVLEIYRVLTDELKEHEIVQKSIEDSTSAYGQIVEKISHEVHKILEDLKDQNNTYKGLSKSQVDTLQALGKEAVLSKVLNENLREHIADTQMELSLIDAKRILGEQIDNNEEAGLKNKLKVLNVLSEINKKSSKYDRINKDISDGLDNISMKYKTLLSAIPIVGPIMISKLDKYKDLLKKATEEGLASMEKNGASPIKAMGDAFGVIKTEMGALNFQLLKISAVVVGIYTLFSMIDNKVKDISSSTGLSANQSYEVYKNALNTQAMFQNQLSTLEEILAVQKAFINETGVLINTSDAMIGKVSDMAQQYGYSQEIAGKLHNTMMQLSSNMPTEQAEELSVKLQYMVNNMAEAQRIAPGIIAKDLVDNSDYVAANFAGLPEDAIKATMEIRKLGSSLGQAAKITNYLFDVQSSLTGAMEASVALGRLINLNKARDLALTGDVTGMMQEINREIGSYSEFVAMSVPQRMLLAKAMGMEVGELQKMLYIQNRLSDLSDEEKEWAANHVKSLEDIKNLNAKDIRIKMKQANQTERLETALGKIKASLIESILPVFELLVPILGIIAKLLHVVLVPLKIIEYIADSINYVFTEWIGKIKWIQSITDGLHTSFNRVLETVDSIFGNETMKKVTGIVGTALLLGAAFAPTRTIVGKIFSLANPIRWFKFVGKQFTGLMGKMTAFKGLNDAIFGKEILKGQFMGTGKGGGRLQAHKNMRVGGLFGLGKGKAIAQARGAQGVVSPSGSSGGLDFLKKLNGIKWGGIAKAAAMMVVLAGGLYIFSKAGAEMAKVEWAKAREGMLMFVGGLVVMMGAAAIAQGLIVPLLVISGVVLAFGAAVAMTGKGLQWASKGFSTLVTSFKEIKGNIDFKTISLITFLGSAILGLGVSLSTALPMLLGGYASLILVNKALRKIGKIAERYQDPIQITSSAISELSNNIMNLSTEKINSFVQGIKDIGSVLNSLDVSVMEKLLSLNYSWGGSGQWSQSSISSEPQSIPSLSTLSSGPSTGVSTTATTSPTTFKGSVTEERLLRIERHMRDMVALFNQQINNPPRIAIMFDDGTVRDLDARIKKTR